MCLFPIFMLNLCNFQLEMWLFFIFLAIFRNFLVLFCVFSSLLQGAVEGLGFFELKNSEIGGLEG